MPFVGIPTIFERIAFYQKCSCQVCQNEAKRIEMEYYNSQREVKSCQDHTESHITEIPMDPRNGPMDAKNGKLKLTESFEEFQR